MAPLENENVPVNALKCKALVGWGGGEKNQNNLLFPNMYGLPRERLYPQKRLSPES